MPIIEINGQKLEFDTAEQANSYLAELDAQSAAPREERTLTNQIEANMSGTFFPPLGAVNAVKDIYRTIKGEELGEAETLSPSSVARGFMQGVDFNKTPEILSAIESLQGGDYNQALAKNREMYSTSESEAPVSYYAGNVAGQVAGLPSKLASSIIGKGGAGLISKLGAGAVANTAVGQTSLPFDATDKERAMQAGIDFGLGTVTGGLDKVLNFLSLKKGVKNALKSGEPINAPYKEGVDARLINARDNLAQDTGVDVPLVAQQMKEDPGFLDMGISQTKTLEQNKALTKVAKGLETDAGMPTRPQSNIKTRLTTNEIAPHIDEVNTTEAIGNKIVAADIENTTVYNNRYGELTNELSASNNDKFTPSQLNQAVKEVTTELSKGTGITETATLNFLKRAREKGLIGEETTVLVKGTGQVLSQADMAQLPPDINPNMFEVRVEPAKVSLENLYKLRKELSDLEFTSEGNNNQPLLRKLKTAIDSEMDLYAKNLNVQNPSLGQKALKLNDDFKSDLSKFENKNVKSILNKLTSADPDNRDVVGATKTLYDSAKKGDLQTIRAIEKLVGPEETLMLKKSMIQKTLRGDNADSYDIQGLSKRMKDLPDEAKNYYFGKQRTNYENLAKVGEYVEKEVDKFGSKYNLEGTSTAFGVARKLLFNTLLSKYNNNPMVAEILVRQKPVTSEMAKFQATRLVQTLFKLGAAEARVDLNKNFTQGE